jgi:hypothetical protein
MIFHQAAWPYRRRQKLPERYLPVDWGMAAGIREPGCPSVQAALGAGKVELHNGALMTLIYRSPFSERLFRPAYWSHKTPGYCWPTPECRDLCVQHVFFEGKNTEENEAYPVVKTKKSNN